jgi:FkbM family methyltransferase
MRNLQSETKAKHVGQYARDAKTWIIERGGRVLLGSAGDLDPAGFAEIPLISVGLRFAWLRSLKAIGIRQIVSKSGLGHPFVCQIGDLAEHPFYIRDAYRKELELCAAWLRQERKEAVVYAVRRLGLQDKVFPFPAAVRDAAGPTQLTYSKQKSLCSQVTPNGANTNIGEYLTHAVGITLNEFRLSSGARPALMKIDVEGSEQSVLRGADTLLSQPDRPAIHFEYNPSTTAQSGESLEAFPKLLSGYNLYYVDDLSGQKFPFGSAINASALKAVDWLCNLFAVPKEEESQSRWAVTLADAQRRIGQLC